jgi:hypothetical protein
MHEFSFVSSNISLGFLQHLECGGEVSMYRGSSFDSHSPPFPELDGYSMSWRLNSDETPYESYATSIANRGMSVSSRIPNMEEYWKDATGLVWIGQPGSVFITLSRPTGSGFAPLIISAFANGLTLVVNLETMFAAKENVPSPTVAGFIERQEPLFASSVRFSLLRSDNLENRPDLRSGWKRAGKDELL